jgi:hypothetical protein
MNLGSSNIHRKTFRESGRARKARASEKERIIYIQQHESQNATTHDCKIKTFTNV